MTTNAINPRRTADVDADIDEFLDANHEEVAAKLAAARLSIERGEARPLEPLEELLREARAQGHQPA